MAYEARKICNFILFDQTPRSREITNLRINKLLFLSMDGPLQGLEMVLSRIGSLVKGIYDSDKDVLLRLREAVTPETPWGNFKTIEAAIMDVADDIAYA